MGDVEVHHELIGSFEFGGIGGGVQLGDGVVRRREREPGRTVCGEPQHAILAGELDPAAPRPEAELLGHEIRRLVRRTLPDPRDRAGPAVGVVLVRATPEPAHLIERRRHGEAHPDPREIVEVLGHPDAVLEANRPVSQHGAPTLVGDLVLSSTAAPPLGPDDRRAAATLAGIDQLEPVEPRGQPARQCLLGDERLVPI